MTSFGAKEVRLGNFMPTFKVQGQVYHLIGDLTAAAQTLPQFLQIYFLCVDEQLRMRSNKLPDLKPDIIAQIQTIINSDNAYIQSFKCALDTSSNIPDLTLIIHADKPPSGEHRGRYNAPTSNEVAVLLVDEDKGPRDIVIKTRGGSLRKVSELHRSYDPLQYPLMFLRGEDGYCLTIPQQNAMRSKTVSCMQYYSFRLMIRSNEFNTLHYFRNLFSQYCVDMAAKMITERLNYIRNNQVKLRAENYIHLRDALNQDCNINFTDIGQYVILPSTFLGSPRYMQEKMQDAITFVKNFGRPDLFVTFTCNPEWPEIKNELFPGQHSFDRHDIVSRVFNLKLKVLMNLVNKHHIFGTCKAFVYTIEWQKRGLPHAHILLWLETKIQPDQIDSIISAELPNPNEDPMLYNIVMTNLIHGPCGAENMASPCMIDNKCSKQFPKKFVSHTISGENGYPLYRRRSPQDGGTSVTINKSGKFFSIDNRWVVPHSPVLCRIFNAHINVEYCHSVKAIQYVCKYIHKGSDQATVSINQNNEIEQYLNGRYISASEAVWRIFEFSIHERHPAVVHLAVHLENGQRVYFTEQNIRERLENPPPTTLTAFFTLCSVDDFAKSLLYHEVPQYYTWANKKFSRRKRGENVPGHPGIKKDSALGRVYTIHPGQSECFHLRMLLQYVRGPTSFENLRTINNQLWPTYKAACNALGLLENDEQWELTLTDAVVSDSVPQFRELFVIILLFCSPANPIALWEKFKDMLCEDIFYTMRQQHTDITPSLMESIYNEGLIRLEQKLYDLGDKSLSEFGLPSPSQNRGLVNFVDNNLNLEYDIVHLNDFVDNNLHKLVPDQRHAFDKIMASIEKNEGKIIFIDAPGGTGKTFLFNLLLAKVRSNGKRVLAVASSGIAATLLTGGKTAHSTFKLPLKASVLEDSMCSIRKNGPLGKILSEVVLVVWDECTMCHKSHIEAVDRSLRDIRNSDSVMGGTTFVFAGDFRQTLPVIPKGTRADIIKACLKSSRLWSSIQTLSLKTNMRAHLGGGNTEFSSELLKLGEGKLPAQNDLIEISSKLATKVDTLDELITKIYPDIDKLLDKNFSWIRERSILSARNSSVDDINLKILKKVPGQLKLYRSIDSVTDIDEVVHYPQEFLNSLHPSGLPHHILELKIGVPIILLRNLNPPNLCNGTRLQVKALKNNIIQCIILTGPAAGQLAHIPRIPMLSTDLPFSFKRLQFPVKISFAITINKSQGQTYQYVGVDLREECFTHGQLYVALSRVGNGENQFILMPSDGNTKNIVFTEILR